VSRTGVIRTVLAFVVVGVFIAGIAFGDPSSSPSPANGATGTDQASAGSASPAVKPSPSATPKIDAQAEWSQAQRIFTQLSPDQQKKFIDNLTQWRAMSPEEQELYRDRDLLHREKIAQEIQDAENKTGLKLDQDQQEVFALRYTQERRKIEDALRKEMDEKRQGMIDAMMSRLKIEFANASPDPAKVPLEKP
jgi:catalase